MGDYDRDFIEQLNKKRNEKAKQDGSDSSRAVTAHTKNKEKPIDNIISFLFTAIAIAIAICFIYSYKKETADTSTPKAHYCKWCGHQEKCKKYTVTILEGYNADGSHKYRRESVYIGNDCISKAKSNGIERGWIEIK